MQFDKIVLEWPDKLDGELKIRIVGVHSDQEFIGTNFESVAIHKPGGPGFTSIDPEAAQGLDRIDVTVLAAPVDFGMNERYANIGQVNLTAGRPTYANDIVTKGQLTACDVAAGSAREIRDPGFDTHDPLYQ